jgi:maltose alpha-D-glucosyltransferase / alpha-amylase
MRHRKHATRAIPDPAQATLWYKDAIIYELSVRAFCDSDADGIGDFRGLTAKLDYLQDLGVTALWLLPFYPSPWLDDGYDIADYTDVHPAYGTLRDFKGFLREAHRHGLRVITELVLNHTSDQHPWFQRARQARPGSYWRDFYVWSETPEKYQEARIIFQDFEPSNWTWDPVAKAYYWHRFYSHQPDLNYENPRVLAAIHGVVDFWLDLGVDGLRLDAVPYLVEADGTPSENLPRTHAILQQLRRHVDRRFTNRMLLAEANQWPEAAAAYFGRGNECHMAFHFPLMPRLFMGLHTEDRFPIVDILVQTPLIPETCQWALFLRNHDELTLEMVTEEERLYLYRIYARDPEARVNLGIRRRLAPLLRNHRRRIELMNGLLFALPGTPVLYYGDEIGMGDNIYLGDRNGVRTPMQWSADRNAGFSQAHPQRLYLPLIVDHEYHHETVHVEAEQRNPHSQLWWMRRLIALRKRYLAFGRGSLELFSPDNRHVLAFLRRYREEQLLVVANLSRFTQYVELDLAAYRGLVPVELFGRTVFPPIGEQPYVLTLGPHAFNWFALEPPRGAAARPPTRRATSPISTLSAPAPWAAVLRDGVGLEEVLLSYLQRCRWFGGRGERVLSMTRVEAVAVTEETSPAYLTLYRVDYAECDPEIYVLPLALAQGARAEELLRHCRQAVIAQLRRPGAGGRASGVLYDAMWNPRFVRRLVGAIVHRRRLRGQAGILRGTCTAAVARVHGAAVGAKMPVSPPREESNTTVVCGEWGVLKLFRRTEVGTHPEFEIGHVLTARGFAHTPPVIGALEHHQLHRGPMAMALVQRFVPHKRDAWEYTLVRLRRDLRRARLSATQVPAVSLDVAALLDGAAQEPPPLACKGFGPMLELARHLGQRTAELHLMLAAETGDPAFAAEPLTALHQRPLYQSLRNLTLPVFQTLRRYWPKLAGAARQEAGEVLAREGEVLGTFRALLQRPFTAKRIRCHGNYHLKQVLCTGTDLVIIDFEGEPARPLFERRLKRPALEDVAGMLRSFHYAAQVASAGRGSPAEVRRTDGASVDAWMRFWQYWVSVAFLQAYSARAAQGTWLPETSAELRLLLNAAMLGRAVYELGYELHHRPDWVRIPLQGILQLLGLGPAPPLEDDEEDGQRP